MAAAHPVVQVDFHEPPNLRGGRHVKFGVRFQVSGVRPFDFGFWIVDFGFENKKTKAHDFGIEEFKD